VQADFRLGRAVSGCRMSHAHSTAPGKIQGIEAPAQAVSIHVADSRGGPQRCATRGCRRASFVEAAVAQPRSRLPITGPVGPKSLAGPRLTRPVRPRPAGESRNRPANHSQAPDSLGQRDLEQHDAQDPELQVAPEELGQSWPP